MAVKNSNIFPRRIKQVFAESVFSKKTLVKRAEEAEHVNLQDMDLKGEVCP